MHINELSGEQQRQSIDTLQVYQAWREARQDKERRFAGSMRWAERNGIDYLLRKVGSRETSLGARGAKTEEAYSAFLAGRRANKEKLEALGTRLEAMGPINRAMGLGRLPTMAARIIRKCDEKALLGKQLFVVGTNALYAYESLAGVRVSSDIVATEDIDLLFDTRRKLDLAVESTLRQSGLIGLLQSVDKSFTVQYPRSFRAANKDGYLVDLIRAQPRNAVASKSHASLSDAPDDLAGAEIFGLDWLINAPKVKAVALDDRGYPVQMIVIDPRVFALHKFWVSSRPDRDPLKRRRDKDQALAAAVIARRFLGLKFEAPEVTNQPEPLRAAATELLDLEAQFQSSSEKPEFW